MSLKQRLIGAAVLIALAVIFIPMLLDGAGWREELTMNMEIPPEPKFTFQHQPPPLPESSSPVKSIDAVRPPPRAERDQPKGAPKSATIDEPKAESAVNRSPASPPAPAADGKPTAQAVGKPKPAVSQPPTLPPPVADKKPTKQPVPKPSAEAWVVQVGSFAKRGNAIVLRDKLVAAGYSAFTEQGGDSKRPLYRVKVGPEQYRERAEHIKGKLRVKEKLKGIIVLRHP